METPLPIETDYPEDVFRPDLAPEYRVGCAKAYFKSNFLARRVFRKRIEVAFRLMPSGQCDRALDAGTGAGFLLPGLAARCREVDGIALSPIIHYTQRMLDNRDSHNLKLTDADLLHRPFTKSHLHLAAG